MEPRRTRALTALRDGFDQLAPDRDRSSDGTEGDQLHKLHRSGHNADDTPGSLSEYDDADNVPEWRALDVDSDLRHPTVTMSEAVARIIATPADRRRLAYVIYRGEIRSASHGWSSRPYDGDPHMNHAHFSGNPDYDDDDRPWSVATMGDNVTTYDETAMRAFPWQYNGQGMPGVPARKSTLWVLGTIYSTATATAAKVDAIAAVLAGHANGDWLRERFGEIDQRVSDLARRVDDVPGAVVDQLDGLDVVDLVDALAAAGVDLDALATAAMERAADQPAADQPADVEPAADQPAVEPR